MSNPTPPAPEAIRAALEDGIQAIGVEFKASCNPLRVALGVILAHHHAAVFDLLDTSVNKVFSPERANEVLRNIAEGIRQGNPARLAPPPHSK